MSRFKNTRTITAPALLMGCLLFGTTLLEFAEAGMQEKDSSNQPAKTKPATEDSKTLPVPPIKRIVLYNSGVGQLQHEVVIEGDKKVRLNFGEETVSDALKSLVVNDSGGSLQAIEYKAAPNPADIAAQTVGQPMTVAQLLQSNRGEDVELAIGQETVRGKVYGVELRTEKENTYDALVLLSDDGLQSFDLAKVNRLKFVKQDLRDQLNLALLGAVAAKQESQKPVDLAFKGDKKRTVKIAYVVDMPIWRMTYRMVFKDDQCQLQGWAHVDNASGVDWDKIALDLRSGKPQAFHTDLFNPIAGSRKDVGTSIYEFLNDMMVTQQRFQAPAYVRSDPTDHRPGQAKPPGGGGFGYGAGGFGYGGVSFGGGGFGGGVGGGGHGGGGFGGVAGGSFGGAGAPAKQEGVEIEDGFASSAESQQVARMVRYQLKDTISLGAGESAALPVFDRSFPAKKVSVMDVSAKRSGAPLFAVELTNDSGLAMLSGPVSVMQQGDFVGDGKLSRVDVKQKSLIHYGVDRAVNVKSLPVVNTDVYTSVVIEKKELVSKHLVSRQLDYQLRNLDTEDRTVMLKLQHPDTTSFSKFAPDAYEQDGRLLTFEVPVSAGQTKTFSVKFDRTDTRRSSWIETVDLLQIEQWKADDVQLTAEDTLKLKTAIEINRRLAELRVTKERLAKRLNTAYREESRAKNDNPLGDREAFEALEAARGVVKELRQSLGKTNKEIDQLLAKKEALIE